VVLLLRLCIWAEAESCPVYDVQNGWGSATLWESILGFDEFNKD